MSIKSKLASVGDSLSNAYNTVDRGLDRSGINLHNWGNVKSIHPPMETHSSLTGVKAVAKGVAGVGSGVFQTATKTGYGGMAYTAATGGTVAISSTGIGALAVAGTYAVGSSIAAGVSAYKTNSHINNLKKIQTTGNQNCGCSGCRLQHDVVFHQVLPYIINKKQRKLRRKGEEMVPVLGGMTTTLETGARSLWKRLRGTRGKERHWYAQVLTIHLISSKCKLAEAIVAELWSHEEMLKIRSMDSNDAGVFIFDKMASM